MKWTVTKLKTAGFDRSEKDGRTLRPRCSQCEVMVIQGTPTHEHGCPNKPGGRRRAFNGTPY